MTDTPPPPIRLTARQTGELSTVLFAHRDRLGLTVAEVGELLERLDPAHYAAPRAAPAVWRRAAAVRAARADVPRCDGPGGSLPTYITWHEAKRRYRVRVVLEGGTLVWGGWWRRHELADAVMVRHALVRLGRECAGPELARRAAEVVLAARAGR